MSNFVKYEFINTDIRSVLRSSGKRHFVHYEDIGDVRFISIDEVKGSLPLPLGICGFNGLCRCLQSMKIIGLKGGD